MDHRNTGDVIDYDVIYAAVAGGLQRVPRDGAGYDEWSGEPARQAIQKRTRLDMVPIPQTFCGMTYGMTELMALSKSRGWAHHGSPVAEWSFDAVEVRHPPGDADQLRPDKPDRNASGKRIDADQPPRWPSPAGASWRSSTHEAGRWLCVSQGYAEGDADSAELDSVRVCRFRGLFDMSQ